MSDSENKDQAVMEVLHKWADAFSSVDPDAIVAMYTSDASLWGTLSSSRRDSHELIRDYFENLFIYPERKVVFDSFAIKYYSDIAVCVGTYLLSWRADAEKVELPARFSFVLKGHDGDWLIVDHHSSAMPC